MMDIDTYQMNAMTTCMESCNNMAYMLLGLQGEVGELSSKFAKAVRREDAAFGGDGEKDINHFIWNFSKEVAPNRVKIQMDEVHKMELDMKHELGDILWFCAGIASVMDWDLSEIAQLNLDKLAARKAHNTIDGDGDHR